jgi:hypothetical protein
MQAEKARTRRTQQTFHVFQRKRSVAGNCEGDVGANAVLWRDKHRIVILHRTAVVP